MRTVGVLLAVLGAMTLLAPGIPPRLMGLALLFSGIRRVVDPERMIESMAWASRPVHGLLILMGALGAAIVAYWTARGVRAQQEPGSSRRSADIAPSPRISSARVLSYAR